MFATDAPLELDRTTTGQASDDELLGAVRSLAERRRELDRVEAIVLGELEARGTTDRELGVRTAAWVARETAIPGTVAK